MYHEYRQSTDTKKSETRKYPAFQLPFLQSKKSMTKRGKTNSRFYFLQKTSTWTTQDHKPIQDQYLSSERLSILKQLWQNNIICLGSGLPVIINTGLWFSVSCFSSVCPQFVGSLKPKEFFGCGILMIYQFLWNSHLYHAPTSYQTRVHVFTPLLWKMAAVG